jgi:DNA repair protein RecO (recombination protein O)
MSISKTEAIVLKGLNYGDTSKIFTLYSKDFGKIKVIVKGYRNPKNKKSGSLGTFFYVQIVFYKKSSSEIHLLSQSEILHPFLKLSKDLDRFAFASAVAELLNRFITQEEPNEKLFSLVLKTFQAIETFPVEKLPVLFWSFALKFSQFLGYQPNFKNCVSCNKKIENTNILFSPEKGGIICSICASRFGFYFMKLTKEEVNLIRNLSSFPMAELEHLTYPGKFDNIAETICSFLSYQAGGKKEISSLEFLQKIC